jgi:hypothetical protein
VRLWTAPAIDQLFIDNRLVWPVSYPNNAAALFLLPFWPLLWMAASSPIRCGSEDLRSGWQRVCRDGHHDAIAGGRVQPGDLTRRDVPRLSNSIANIRLSCVPALLLLYQFPILNRYWVLGPAAVGGALGARTLLVASLAATCAGTLLALLERRVPKGPTVKRSFGAIVLVFVAGSVVWGTAAATRDAGGPIGWVTENWQRFTGTSTVTVTEEPAHTHQDSPSSPPAAALTSGVWPGTRSDPLH